MKNCKYLAKDVTDTKQIAFKVAQDLLLIRDHGESGILVCLWGDVGAGKTTFVQGLAEQLGVEEVVNSPTFLVMKKYLLTKSWDGYNLFHFDCYRVNMLEDVLNLGWREILSDKRNIIFVEWPDKILNLLPAKKINIRLMITKDNFRKIIVSNEI